MKHGSKIKSPRQAERRRLSLALVAALLFFAVLPWASGTSGASADGGASAGGGNAPLLYSTSRGKAPAAKPAPEGPLARGKFLVASRGLGDPRFMETVILLLDYDWEGAMGLIINRPTGVQLAELFPEIDGLRDRANAAYYGGPVESHRMWLLVRSASPLKESELIVEGVYASASRDMLEGILGGKAATPEFRMYSGYAGWGPGQLEGEIARGDWHVTDADAETVFHKAPEDVWPALISRFAGIQARAAVEPGMRF